MNWNDWFQLTAARLRQSQSAFRSLSMLGPARIPMDLPLSLQNLLQNAATPLTVEQLQAFYCKFFLLDSNHLYNLNGIFFKTRFVLKTPKNLVKNRSTRVC